MTEQITCADEDLDVGCKDGKCDCPCNIPCDCGSCCGCCTVYCGHAFYCESVNPIPTQAEMFAEFAYMESAPYRFPALPTTA